MQYLWGLYSFLTTSSIVWKIVLFSLATLIGGILAALCTPSLPGVVFAASFSTLFLILPRILFHIYKPQPNILFSKITSPKIVKTFPVLVVGGAGYIGYHIVQQLLKKGYRVRVFDTFYYDKHVFDDIPKSMPLEIIRGDITDIYQLNLALQNIQAVIHLAGLVGDPSCAIDDNLTRHINVSSTRLLKEAVKAFGIQRFIFASSCSVYGMTKHIATEESRVHPLSLYAQTKLDSEKELLRDTFDNFHPTILRFATVFGHSQRMRFDLIINQLTAQAFEKGSMTLYGGQQIRPFIHVRDVARAVLLTLESPLSTVSRRIFNVGDSRMNYSIQSLAEHIAALVESRNHTKPVLHILEHMKDHRSYAVSFDRIHQNLGFVAATTLQQGVKEIYMNLKKHRYVQPLTNKKYSNVKMTAAIQKKYCNPQYQQTHYASLNEGSTNR